MQNLHCSLHPPFSFNLPTSADHFCPTVTRLTPRYIPHKDAVYQSCAWHGALILSNDFQLQLDIYPGSLLLTVDLLNPRKLKRRSLVYSELLSRPSSGNFESFVSPPLGLSLSPAVYFFPQSYSL